MFTPENNDEQTYLEHICYIIPHLPSYCKSVCYTFTPLWYNILQNVCEYG